ncbi:MAG TPA: FHA domain-containing protein, partial [Pirellulaceae bacterium]|nr:FHA domain-containing protein [Pirellulaceae bacterium]
MASLQIVAGMNAGQIYPLDDREIFVGRESTCHVVLPHRTVSRAHCRILMMPDGYFIEDLQSVNGTCVNGKKIERRTQLVHRDRIRIHDIVLVFIDEVADHDSKVVVRLQPADSAQAHEATAVATVSKPVVKVRTRPREENRIVTSLDARAGAELRWEINAQMKLKAILAITQNLGSTLDTDAVLPRILESLFHIFP